MAADNSLMLAVAHYVRELAVGATSRAEDRPALKSLAAHAAGLLAESVLRNEEAVAEGLASHERLRGHTWLQGAAAGELDRLWAIVRSHSSRPAI